MEPLMEPEAPRKKTWLHPNRWADWLFNGRSLQRTVPLVALLMVAASSAFAYWWLDGTGKRVLLEHEIVDLADDTRLRATEIRAEFGQLARAVRWFASQKQLPSLMETEGHFAEGGKLGSLVGKRLEDAPRGVTFDESCLEWMALVEFGPGKEPVVSHVFRGRPTLTDAARRLAERALDGRKFDEFRSWGGVAMPSPWVM
jgi:hypothetical protein